MATRTALAYEEVVDFIAAGPKPGKIIAFKPSVTTKERVADLIYREKAAGLTSDERSELEHYLQLEHLMRLTKARARRYTANEQLRQ